MDAGDLDGRVRAVAQILDLGAIAVVGAGLSISSRFPDTKGLTTLLWEALDTDPAARASLAEHLTKSDAATKQLIGDEWPSIQAAWATVAGSGVARARFQQQFAALDRDRSSLPSQAHEALARLVHAGVVECVVSLNWDTALENAYLRLYGVMLPRGVLMKPHGDAAHPDTAWTLPHEPGLVPREVLDRASQLSGEHARALLVVGYSESDQVVVDELVKPLDRSSRTIRIGPSATRSEDLPFGAEIALPRLAAPYLEMESRAAWHTVTFSGRRGLNSALTGERLGPMDVMSCPELDEVEVVLRGLAQDKAVVLNGPTGAGKSITAYQVLHKLKDQGYEILRLRDDARARTMSSWLSDLRGSSGLRV